MFLVFKVLQFLWLLYDKFFNEIKSFFLVFIIGLIFMSKKFFNQAKMVIYT